MIRQISRGCGVLPHVGDHPGWMALIMFVILGFYAGMPVGLALVIPAAIAFAYGAYSRAELSDLLETQIGGNS